MSLALSHEHLTRPPTAKDLDGRPDDRGVRVDVRGHPGRLDQVRLDEDRLAPRPVPPEAQLGEPPADDGRQVVSVRGRLRDADVGAAGRLVMVVYELQPRRPRQDSPRAGEKPSTPEAGGRCRVAAGW